MSKITKEKASSFSWNDQSANIRTVTRETRNKINIEIYEKCWKAEYASVEAPGEKFSKPNTSRFVRHLKYSLNLKIGSDSEEKANEEKNKIVRKVALNSNANTKKVQENCEEVFIHILEYAIKRGGHAKITSDPRLRLKVHTTDLLSKKDIAFDLEKYKTNYQGFFPRWAKEITLKVPGDRTEDEISSLQKILKQLKEFRRYSPEIQWLLCKVVKYDRFGRHRVIIRKGHVGRRFYIIFSGTVAFTLSEDDNEVYAKPTVYYQLGKGDAFGEYALIRDGRRSATIVCLQTTEFLYIEKEDFNALGIVDILRNEMLFKVECLREFDLFSTWPQHVLKKVAEESRSMEYRNDAIIDNNLLQTDLLYVVVKGRCQVLRLLDLTENKKWMKLRRDQKKIYDSEFPESKSPQSYSRMSTLSNMTGWNELRIPKTYSQPHAPSPRAGAKEQVQPRLVKSAQCTLNSREENVGVKRASYSRNSREQEAMAFSRGTSAVSMAGTKQSFNIGVGVFLCLDVIEEGKCVGLQGVLRANEVKPKTSELNWDKRHLTLISKGCLVISVPVETVTKHADIHTTKKIHKQVKVYPSDEALVDCYLEKSRWNAYKDLVIGRMMKDIEQRRNKQKPGSMVPGTAPPAMQRQIYAISRPGTRQAVLVEPLQPMIPERAQILEKHRSPARCFPSPTIQKITRYPHQSGATVYAQGSRRNLLLVTERIRTNPIQEQVEDELLNCGIRVL